MKKLLIMTGFIAFCFAAKAQPGTACINAVAFPSTNSSINNNNMTGSEMWFSFVGELSPNIDIILYDHSTSLVGHAHKMELYEGTCTGLTLKDTSVVGDSSIYMREYSIVNGQQYYIRAIKEVGSSCMKCNQPSTNFLLQLVDRNRSGVWDCANPGCGQHIVNGDFEANAYSMNPLFPFNYGWVACWGAMFGSPQIGGASPGDPNPAHSGSYCARMWNGDAGEGHTPPHNGEGIATFLHTPLVKNNLYILSYWVRNDFTTGTAPTTSIKTVLTMSCCSGMTADGIHSGTPISIVPPDEVISNESNFNNPNWTLFSECFLATDNWDFLYFFPENNQDGTQQWIDVDDIQINDQSPVDAGPDRTICKGSTTTLGNGCPPIPGVIYEWTPATGLDNPNSPNPNTLPTLASSVTYTLTAYLIHNEVICYSSTDQVTVNIAEQPALTISPSTTTICSGATVNLAATVTTPTQTGTYLWTPGGMTTSSVSVSPSVTTTYTCSYTVGSCTGTATATIIVNPTPVFTISGSTTSCSGPAPNYTAVPTVSIPGTVFNWTASSGGTTLATGTGLTAVYSFPTTGGTMTFVATTPAGCSYTTSLYVGSCCAPSGIPNFINKNVTALAALGTTSGGTTTITNQTFALNGTFTVNQNLILRGCDLRMGYLCQILVDPGMTLTITNNGISDKTHIYACNEMWDGIYVTNSTSTVIINNGSTVEDALNMIVSDNKGKYTISSTTALGNVIFNKNYKTIVVKNDLTGTNPGVLRSATIQCYDGVVGGNPVNTTNKLRYPHTTERSYIGVEITNVNSISIGAPTALATNTFDNMDYGINSANSSLNVYNNDFKNINYFGPPPAKGIECSPGTAICASGGKTVVRTINVGSSLSFPFYKNTFTGCFKGIVATFNMNSNVWKNDFNNITSTGVRLSANILNTIVVNENTINSARFGIDCFNNQSSNITIDNNDIDAGLLPLAQGVSVQEIISGSTVYNVTRNTIKNVRYGAIVSGLKNSNFNSNNIYLKHTSSPAQECYGVRLTNSGQCNVVGNYVLGTNPADYWVHGISLDLCYSDYVTCNESHQMGTGMFFGGVQTPNTYIAKNQMDNNYRGFVLNFGEVGPQYTVGTPNKPNDNRWSGSFTYHTYSFNSPGSFSPIYVRTTPGQYNPPSYSAFAIPSTPFNLISLVPIPGNLNSLVCPLIILPGGGPPKSPVMLQIAGDSIVPVAYDASTRWMLKQSLYQYLKVDPSLIATEPLIASFNSYHATHNMGKLDDVETGLSDPASISPATLSSMQGINNTVTPTNDVETNSKWINDLLISNTFAGNDYSASQINDLKVLAAKCPYNDGPAVYQARVILSQIEDVEYLNECEMIPDDASDRSMSSASQMNDHDGEKFQLYPNPNDGSMNFIYSLEDNSKGQIDIFDMTGKLVATYNLIEGKNNQILINETQLNSGVYFYKVIVDNQLRLSDKIVIIK